MAYRRHWDTLDEYLELSGREESPLGGGRRDRASRTTDSSFAGTRSYAEAADLARNGWPEGAERIERLAARMRERIGRQLAEIETPALDHDVAGFMPDVGAYLAGEPDAMLTWEPRVEPKPTVSILVHTGMLAMTSLAAYERRGAAAAALVDLLESSGVRCEVVGFHAVGATGALEHSAWSVTIKRPDMPLDLDRLAFLLAHPSSHRRINFGVREQTIEEAGDWPAHGYGHTEDLFAEEQDGHIYIGALSYGAAFGSDAEADEWILEQLRGQGIEV